MKVQLADQFVFTDKFNALRSKLTEEFLLAYPDFKEYQAENMLPQKKEVVQWNSAGNKAAGDAWRVEGLKYTDPQGKMVLVERNRSRFPTAWALMEEFGDKCPIATYSVIQAHSVIKRHTGIENRESKYVRCHIPLIVPDGDVAFEVEGREIKWDNCFAFDNQCEHSAWNKTSYRRLVFLIDLERSVVGWPPK